MKSEDDPVEKKLRLYHALQWAILAGIVLATALLINALL
jgi:hypothetical protein